MLIDILGSNESIESFKNDIVESDIEKIAKPNLEVKNAQTPHFERSNSHNPHQDFKFALKLFAKQNESMQEKKLFGQ